MVYNKGCPVCGSMTGQHGFSFDERARDYQALKHREAECEWCGLNKDCAKCDPEFYEIAGI